MRLKRPSPARNWQSWEVNSRKYDSMIVAIKKLLRKILQIDKRRAMVFYRHDCARFLACSGVGGRITRGTLRAKIIMHYHVVEKGLTMPNRHLAFGKGIVANLMKLIQDFSARFGLEDAQVKHAIGVLKEYFELHRSQGYDFDSDAAYWQELSRFLDAYAAVEPARQHHVTFGGFYAANESPFPVFAQSRHSVRNYTHNEIPAARLAAAVSLALTTPSACNRQYCKVHCLSGERKRKLLELQGGNRGFGNLADKVLVVTSSLEGIASPEERNDIFVNGGMFLMNLCYALHYHKIAHCILTWAQSLAKDAAAREIMGPTLKKDETIIALLSCGEAPGEFDVADSPRKSLDEVFVHE